MPPLTVVLEAMRQQGIVFEKGLMADEFESLEHRNGFRFPDDLREFLSLGLPVSDHFPDWRTGKVVGGHGSRSTIDGLIDWPARGMCFDIENNGFWMQEWGPRPDQLEDAFQVAREFVKQAPPLIPVFSHRFLPAEPLTAGNPVLSVYQTDIIYYGPELASYWVNEFKLPIPSENKEPKSIRFWSDIIDGIGVEQKSNRFMP
ncbi:MAG: hypothetical protein WBE13_20750 [Candidatus Acidiferrum sp.]